VLGLLLAALGVYGLTAFTVARREREFGIRTALGAMRSEILRLVLRQSLGPVVCGCVMGVLLAAAVARVLGGFLLGLPALDLPAYAGSITLFLVAGSAACIGPSRRASRTNPASALRAE
jgi:ABC-type antimicrobial peptide transport system permease subunit